MQKPLFTTETGKNKYREHAAALTRWLNILVESENHIALRKENDDISYETVTLGTTFLDISWVTDRVMFRKQNPDGAVEPVDKVIYEGTRALMSRIEDFITRPEWHDIQKAPWCGFWYRLFRHEVANLGRTGYFNNEENVETVLGSPSAENPPNVENEEARHGVASSTATEENNEVFDIFKIYLTFDIDDDGIYEEMIVWFHPKTNTFLRAEYNNIGKKPVVRLPYFNISKMLYGVGVCFMSEYIQEELDFLHNVRNNSLTASSLQMIVSRVGSGIQKGEKLFPMKHIQTQTPKEDIDVLSFPDVSGSTFTAEEVGRQLLAQFVGASEARMGLPDTVAKSGTSSSLQMFLAQQGNKVQRAIMTTFRENYGQIGQFFLMHMVANRDLTKRFLLPLADEADQGLIEEVLTMEVEDIPLNFTFTVKLTDPDKTEEAQRQTLMTVDTLYDKYFQQLFMLLQQIGQTEQALELATQYYVGKNILMDEIIKLLTTRPSEDLLPFYRDVEYMINLREQQKEQALLMLENKIGGMRNEQANRELGGDIAPSTAGLTPEEAKANELAHGEMEANEPGV